MGPSYLTVDQLRELTRVPGRPGTLTLAELQLYAGEFNRAGDEFGVTVRLERVAAFLGQTLHESGRYRRLVESFAYRPESLLATFPRYVRDLDDAAQLLGRGPRAVAERVYGGRLGNGPEGSGDGWAYRGRGVVQLTGRRNYLVKGRRIGVPLELEPERAATAAVMFRVAGSYFLDEGLLELADAHTWPAFVDMTRRINGGLNGLRERWALFKAACTILGLRAPEEV